MESDEANRAIFDRLVGRVGPGAVRFIEYASTELWRRARASALEQGFTALEAENIARATVAGAVKAMAAEVGTVKRLRGFGIVR